MARVLPLLALLAACSGITARTDYDPELDFSGLESWAWCVAFSPDGALVAGGGGNYEGTGAGALIWAGG